MKKFILLIFLGLLGAILYFTYQTTSANSEIENITGDLTAQSSCMSEAKTSYDKATKVYLNDTPERAIEAIEEYLKEVDALKVKEGCLSIKKSDSVVFEELFKTWVAKTRLAILNRKLQNNEKSEALLQEAVNDFKNSSSMQMIVSKDSNLLSDQTQQLVQESTTPETILHLVENVMDKEDRERLK